jgi:exonuclease VII small subunit
MKDLKEQLRKAKERVEELEAELALDEIKEFEPFDPFGTLAAEGGWLQMPNTLCARDLATHVRDEVLNLDAEIEYERCKDKLLDSVNILLDDANIEYERAVKKLKRSTTILDRASADLLELWNG